MRPLLRIARHPASGLVLLAGLAITWPLAHLVGCMSKPREASAGEPVPTVALPAAASSASVDPAVPKAASDAPRLYAKTRFVWIKPEPGAEGWIGFLWTGGSVKLRPEEPRPGAGCATKWYPIEPRGWVCADGERATIDPRDPVLGKIRPYAPKLESPWPHRYGESRGLARYRTRPTPEEQRRREWDLRDHLARVAEANGDQRHESLLGVDLTRASDNPIELGTLPATIHEHRKRLVPTSTVAWSAETFAHGRSWLLGADYVWIAKDRVAPYAKVTFQGVHLGRDAKLPLAFFRDADSPKLAATSGDELVATGKSWPRLGWVELTGREREQGGEKYLETRDGGLWIQAKQAVLPRPQEQTPWGAPVGGADTDKAPPGRRTWIEVSVWQGWLIAYEGTKPVFTTLISPGRGGTPERGKPAIDTASTPVGTFKITGKFATATMEAPGELIHSDVPWTQNFSGPHALHGAYWHDKWGHRMSGGCVNASPIDAKWLYEFTEPPVPEGWHGVRWRPSSEPATTFVVHD